MTPQVILTITSVFIGFILFTLSFASFMYKKPAKVTWTLFTIAIVFITLVPVVVAVFWGSMMH